MRLTRTATVVIVGVVMVLLGAVAYNTAIVLDLRQDVRDVLSTPTPLPSAPTRAERPTPTPTLRALSAVQLLTAYLAQNELRECRTMATIGATNWVTEYDGSGSWSIKPPPPVVARRRLGNGASQPTSITEGVGFGARGPWQVIEATGEIITTKGVC